MSFSAARHGALLAALIHDRCAANPAIATDRHQQGSA